MQLLTPVLIALIPRVLAFTVSQRVDTRAGDQLPVIDLGYVKQQAIILKDGIYSFSNIRYARAPIGNLRWHRPQHPQHEKDIQNGQHDKLCYQSQPYWESSVLGPWIEAVELNQTSEFFEKYPTQPAGPALPNNLTSVFPSLLPGEGEDCLFLDLFVPKKVLDHKSAANASVFVYIHGGGLILGSKTGDGNLSALAVQSLSDGNEPVITVAMNYRLGAFGFMGGPQLHADGGTSNVALLDQQFALEWVKSNIHLFGGNASKVTIAGQSGGGASVVHHLVLYGGKGQAPMFQQAFVQSGGWNPTHGSAHLDEVYQKFLRRFNVTSLQDAKQQSSIDLRNVNFALEYEVGWGGFAFGIEADGILIPSPPAQLFLNGQFHKNITILSSHVAHEGLLFASPWCISKPGTLRFAHDALPDTSPSQITYILNTLYPLSPDSVHNDAAALARAQLMTSEASIICNTNSLAHAYHNQTFNYRFNVGTANHADDLAYTFYDPATTVDGGVDPQIARAMQNYLLNFINHGDPSAANGARVPVPFERYGRDAFTLSINDDGFTHIVDPGDNDRCRWWQHGFYQKS